MIVGSATIEIRADTSKFAGQVNASVRQAASSAEQSLGAGVERGAARGRARAEREFKSAGQAAEQQFRKAGQSAEREFSSAGKGIRNALGAAAGAFIAQRVVSGLVSATKAASDLNEAVNVTGLVFKEGRAEMETFVKNSVDMLGISERSARQLTASLGGLLQNQGLNAKATVEWSKRLAVLGADMGSAFNVEPAEAIQAIGSALRGEQEPIRRFNVSIDAVTVAQKAVQMGLASSTSEVSKQAKTMATLQLIMEQTKAVHGDFANTSDDAAGQMRKATAAAENAKAAFGEALIPVMKTAAGAVEGLSKAFSALPDAWQSAFAFGGVALAATIPLAMLVRSVNTLRDAYAATTLAQSTLVGGLGKFARFGVAVGAAYGLATAFDAVVKSIVNIGKERPELDRLTRSLLDVNKAIDDFDPADLDLADIKQGFQAIEMTAKEYGRTWADVAKHVRADLDNTLDPLDKSAARLVRNGNLDQARARIEELAKKIGVTPKQVLTFLDDYDAALEEVKTNAALAGASSEEGAEGIQELGDAAGPAATEADRLADAVDRVRKAVDDATGSVVDNIEAEHNLADSLANLREAVRGDPDAGRGVQQATKAQTKAAQDVAEAQRNLNEAIAKHGQGSDEVRAAEERLRGARENLNEATQRRIDAERDLAAASPRTAEGLRKQEAAALAVYEAYTEQAEAQVRAGQMRPSQVPQFLIDKMRELRNEAPLVAHVFDAIIAKLEKMKVDDTILEFISAYRSTRRGSFGFQTPLPPERPDSYREPRRRPRGRQHGGPVVPGELYRVGEAGPELAVFPRPGHIIPNDVSERLLDAISKQRSGLHQEFHISGAFPFNPTELARALLRERDWSLR